MGLLDTRDPHGFKPIFTKAKPLDWLMGHVLHPFTRKTGKGPVPLSYGGIFMNHVIGQQGIVAASKVTVLFFALCAPSFWFYMRQARKHPYRPERH